MSHLEFGAGFDRRHLILALAQAEHAALHPAVGSPSLLPDLLWVPVLVVSAMVTNTKWLPTDADGMQRIQSVGVFWRQYNILSIQCSSPTLEKKNLADMVA